MDTQKVTEMWNQEEERQATFRAAHPERRPHYHGRRGWGEHLETWIQHDPPDGDPEVGALQCWCDAGD